MFRIGVLLPRSTLFPSIGLDILNGIKACLKHYGIFDDCKLLTDNIGFGIEEPEIYSKAEKLLLQEDADMVIVIADTRVGEMLQPLFTASNKLLMMVNFGANFPESWQPAPTTITHSLNFCLHTRLTAKLAITENADKQAVYATSYYDGGYKQCYSMLNSHQQNGGIPLYTHVTHFKAEDFALAPLAAFLEEHEGVHIVLSLFAGDLAARFYQDIAPLQEKFQLRLYVAPMLLDESLAENPGGFAIQNTKGYTPWASTLDNEHNRVFGNAFAKAANKKANLFGVLGWDTGLLIKACKEEQDAGHAPATVLTALAGKTFESPRGWMKLDAATGHTYGACWLAQATGNMQLQITGEAAGVEEEWKQFTAESFPQGESSSWRNTYLCI